MRVTSKRPPRRSAERDVLLAFQIVLAAGALALLYGLVAAGLSPLQIVADLALLALVVGTGIALAWSGFRHAWVLARAFALVLPVFLVVGQIDAFFITGRPEIVGGYTAWQVVAYGLALTLLKERLAIRVAWISSAASVAAFLAFLATQDSALLRSSLALNIAQIHLAQIAMLAFMITARIFRNHFAMERAHREVLERTTTQLRRAVREAEAARREVETANRAKSDFLATMSHELRTPLNAIIGFSELLMGDSHRILGEERAREYAAHVHESGVHLLRLVDDILQLARIETGQVPIDPVPVDPVQDLREVIDIIAPQTAARDVQVQIEVRPPLPPLRTDRRALRQILFNLLANALRRTPPHGRILFLLCPHEQSGLLVEVRDSGGALDREELDIAGVPFARAGDPLHASPEGLMLELPIAKSLAELLGGTLSLHNDDSPGLTVRVHLPDMRRIRQDLPRPVSAWRESGA